MILTSIYWPHLNDFILVQEIINIGPVALGGEFSEEGKASNILLTIVDKENVGISDQLKWSNLALFQ